MNRGIYRYTYMKCYVQRSTVTFKTVIAVCKTVIAVCKTVTAVCKTVIAVCKTVIAVCQQYSDNLFS